MVDPGPLPAAIRIDLAQEPPFDLGDMRVVPAERSVIVDGQRRELQPRVMQVLVALAKARPEVVSRDKLIDLCWEGRIVGDDSLNRCILALRHLAQEFTPNLFIIETVPRIGHRLIEGSEQDRKVVATRSPIKRWPIAAALSLLLIALVGGFVLWQQRSVEAKPASIAVLPFRNLSNGDSHFAEGIGEEILGQLAREPSFRVAGSNSPSQIPKEMDSREIARRLKVDYLLEGSVRRQGNLVRVNAGLVRASDGSRLWSDTYDGKLDDIFAIQSRIGTAIATALQRRLLRAPALSGPLVTKGEAYNLYLTARALIRTRNRRVGPTALDLLRDAIRIDPGYAPAWASLAEATQLQGAQGDRETFIAAVHKARDYARQSVNLAPELAEAHQALGRTFGHGDPEGVAHLRRAAALDPNNAESLIDVGSALAASGEFERELATYRRAHELDPLWYRTTGIASITLAEMGERAEAEALGRRGLPDKDANLHILLGRIAWTFADYSEAARRWAIVARSNSPRWANTAQRTLLDAKHAVGVSTGALVDVPEPPAARTNWRAWMDAPPTPGVWRQRNRDSIAAEVYRKHNLLAAKLMLNAGRSRELVTSYDSPTGLFGLGAGRHVRVDQLREAPIVALALRNAGRIAEANRVLRESDATIRTVYRRGRVPFWFDADAAALFAVEGRKDEALSTLARAFDRGWRQNGGSDLRDIADEPAFRALHDDPRFTQLRSRIAAHYAREREEVALLKI
jgi:TolB-like protein/DNA-binding winged helix-turn-helix (wHTH) protein/tetratricopeptide (TPR) repeat protein